MTEGWQRLKYLVDINSRDIDETRPSFEFRYVDIGSVGRGILLEEPERTASRTHVQGSSVGPVW